GPIPNKRLCVSGPNSPPSAPITAMADDPRSSSGSHQILATSDVARLMAFACSTFSDDDLPTVKIPASADPNSTLIQRSTERATGLHRRIASWNGRSGEVGCCEHPVFGQ